MVASPRSRTAARSWWTACAPFSTRRMRSPSTPTVTDPVQPVSPSHKCRARISNGVSTFPAVHPAVPRSDRAGVSQHRPPLARWGFFARRVPSAHTGKTNPVKSERYPTDYTTASGTPHHWPANAAGGRPGRRRASGKTRRIKTRSAQIRTAWATQAAVRRTKEHGPLWESYAFHTSMGSFKASLILCRSSTTF